MSNKKSVLVSHATKNQEIILSHQPKHMHRRSASKTSAELQETLKNTSPPASKVFQLITPQQIKSHLETKGICIVSHDAYDKSSDSLSDDELNIRNIIEQRKALSPNYLQEPKENSYTGNCKRIKSQDVEGVSVNSSTTAFTSNEESNFERIVYVMEKANLVTSCRGSKKTIVELMQKSPEPHFALILDENMGLRGIYYVEVSTGFFHRILGNCDTHYVIPPRRVKQFLYYDLNLLCFMPASASKFDAIVVK